MSEQSKPDIQEAFENQQDAMIAYRAAAEAVKADIRDDDGSLKNNRQLYESGQLSRQAVSDHVKRSANLAKARKALDEADEQLRKAVE